MEKKKKLGLKTEPPKDTFCTRGYSRSQKKLTGFFCLLFREKKMSIQTRLILLSFNFS